MVGKNNQPTITVVHNQESHKQPSGWPTTQITCPKRNDTTTG